MLFKAEPHEKSPALAGPAIDALTETSRGMRLTPLHWKALQSELSPAWGDTVTAVTRDQGNRIRSRPADLLHTVTHSRLSPSARPDGRRDRALPG